MNISQTLRQKLGKPFMEHEEMRAHTSIGCGGAADFFFEASSTDQIIGAVKLAQELALPYRVIGNGNNILVSDVGYPGLVILNRTNRLILTPNKNQIMADAGTPLAQLIKFAAEASLSGLEPLFGIPGTVGGAVYGNAGAHGVEIGNFVKRVTLLTAKGETVTLPPRAMEFGYRSSRLKKNITQNPPVILVVTFQFVQRRKDEILADLKQYQNWRFKNQPINEKSSGSVFKNPGGTSRASHSKESAGYLIDSVGLRGFKEGGAMISKLHANWIINRGKATSKDIKSLIDIIKTKVREKYGVILEEEIEYLGRWL